MSGYGWLLLGILAGIGGWTAIQAVESRLVAVGVAMFLVGALGLVVVYGPTGVLYLAGTVPAVLFVLYLRDRRSDTSGQFG